MTKALFPDRGLDIEVVSAVTSLAFPPVKVADVSVWNAVSVMAQFDIEVWAAAAVNLTLTELFGGVLVDITIASDDIDTVDFGNNELDITTHGLETGDGPLQLTTTAADLPAGLLTDTDYWVIEVNSGTIKLALSLEGAIEGTNVAFTDAGTGTHTILGSGTAGAAFAIRWLNYGFLGPANDGAITLAEFEGYTTRVNHRPRTVLYAVGATLSDTIATTITVHPVQEKP